MEATLQKPALVAVKTAPNWIVTAFFCLQMSFTAYAQLRLPEVAQAFTRLLPGGALVCQAPRRGADAYAGAKYARRCSRPACRSEDMSAKL
jgi:hypothetical protein